MTAPSRMVDPMCGSGTFVIEAAEIAARLNPGRARALRLRTAGHLRRRGLGADARGDAASAPAGIVCHGRDRDAGAIAMSQANAERAGVAGLTAFRQGAISELQPPEGPPGLVIVNPPFGARLGESAKLAPLYRALGQVLTSRFAGWRVGLVAQEAKLAHATGLPFLPPGPPVPHGGLRVTLYRTGPLG